MFQNFHDLFFRSTKLIFWGLPKHCFAPILAKFSAPQANFWKNSKKSRFWALFEKFWQQVRFFFGARSPSKLVPIGANGAFRKILGSFGQKWISEKVSKGGPFGSAGGRIPEERGVSASPPPPKSAPAFLYTCFYWLFSNCMLSQGIKIQQIISLLIKTRPLGAFWKLLSEIVFNAFSYFQWPYVDVNENRKSEPLLGNVFQNDLSFFLLFIHFFSNFCSSKWYAFFSSWFGNNFFLFRLSKKKSKLFYLGWFIFLHHLKHWPFELKLRKIFYLWTFFAKLWRLENAISANLGWLKRNILRATNV